MNKGFLASFMAAFACLIADGAHLAKAQTNEIESLTNRGGIGTIYSPNAFKVPYLGVNGAFTIDTKTITAFDPRNPKRVVFKEMEYFSFYADLKGTTPLATECRYVYKGAAGDPYYYSQFKTSVWDLFELTSGAEACNNFYYVILRSPHGSPVHMHMRYGNARSSFRKLLNLSKAGPENPNSLDPWWSVYCQAGVSGCD
jgi:hypothetical protein